MPNQPGRGQPSRLMRLYANMGALTNYDFGLLGVLEVSSDTTRRLGDGAVRREVVGTAQQATASGELLRLYRPPADRPAPARGAPPGKTYVEGGRTYVPLPGLLVDGDYYGGAGPPLLSVEAGTVRLILVKRPPASRESTVA